MYIYRLYERTDQQRAIVFDKFKQRTHSIYARTDTHKYINTIDIENRLQYIFGTYNFVVFVEIYSRAHTHTQHILYTHTVCHSSRTGGGGAHKRRLNPLYMYDKLQHLIHQSNVSYNIQYIANEKEYSLINGPVQKYLNSFNELKNVIHFLCTIKSIILRTLSFRLQKN